jgi:hypothetical protein
MLYTRIKRMNFANLDIFNVVDPSCLKTKTITNVVDEECQVLVTMPTNALKCVQNN